jgi:hypothetical protein
MELEKLRCRFLAKEASDIDARMGMTRNISHGADCLVTKYRREWCEGLHSQANLKERSMVLS